MQDGQRAAVRVRNPFACGSDAWLVFPRGGSDARGVLRRAVATAVTKCRRHGHFLPRHRVRALTEWWQDCVCQLSVFFFSSNDSMKLVTSVVPLVKLEEKRYAERPSMFA